MTRTTSTHMLRRSARPLRRGPAARATALLEFALILPALLFLIIFSIDLGHLILVKGAFQDATYASARAGAQIGAPGDRSQGQSLRVFREAAAGIPSVDERRAELILVEPRICTGDQNVTVRSRYEAELITPGLRPMLSLFSGRDQGQDGTYPLIQTAVARCEIVRAS